MVRHWSLKLEDGVEAEVPVPNGHCGAITGIQAADGDAVKIFVEAICVIVRTDKLDRDEDDEVQPTDHIRTVMAVLFPKIQPIAQLRIQFSMMNFMSMRATGGSVTVTGLWNPDDSLIALA
jgi:hypothetical protein